MRNNKKGGDTRDADRPPCTAEVVHQISSGIKQQLYNDPQAVQRAFSIFDEDASGELRLAQFTQGLAKLGFSIRPSQAKALFLDLSDAEKADLSSLPVERFAQFIIGSDHGAQRARSLPPDVSAEMSFDRLRPPTGCIFDPRATRPMPRMPPPSHASSSRASSYSSMCSSRISTAEPWRKSHSKLQSIHKDFYCGSSLSTHPSLTSAAMAQHRELHTPGQGYGIPRLAMSALHRLAVSRPSTVQSSVSAITKKGFSLTNMSLANTKT